MIAASVTERTDREVVASLRRGDEAAFVELVERYQRPFLRVAMSFVGDREVAEEIVQETWLGVLRGLESFRGDSSLKTWMFRILRNQALSRAERERRTVPLSALDDAGEPAVDADRFFDESHPQWPGHWALPPSRWDTTPEDRLFARETIDCIRGAIEGLPLLQQQVIGLRDVEGWPAEEVCEALSISDGHQRVLLHRARSKVRSAIEQHFLAAAPSSAG